MRFYLVFHVLVLAFLSQVSADDTNNALTFRGFCCHGVCIPVLHQKIRFHPGIVHILKQFRIGSLDPV